MTSTCLTHRFKLIGQDHRPCPDAATLRRLRHELKLTRAQCAVVARMTDRLWGDIEDGAVVPHNTETWSWLGRCVRVADRARSEVRA